MTELGWGSGTFTGLFLACYKVVFASYQATAKILPQYCR